MAEQFVKRKGPRKIRTTGFSFRLRRGDYFEGGAQRHVSARKNISRLIGLKDYINTRFVDF